MRQTLTWQALARCLEVDPEIFFPERGGSSRAARAVCAMCPVRTLCLRYALARSEQFGIWGGTSERERRKLKKLSVTAVEEHEVKQPKSAPPCRKKGAAA